MSTTTIENQTTIAQTVTTQTVVTQSAAPPDEGALMAATFLARLIAGQCQPGELLALIVKCSAEQIPSFANAVQERLAFYADPRRGYANAIVNVAANAVIGALPQALRMRGHPNDVPVITMKAPPPTKRMDVVRDANGVITGAVMRTGS